MINGILQTLVGVCMAAMAAAAQNPFIGDWTLDPSNTRMPDEMRVAQKGGHTYAFDFAGTVETIVVDGTDQPGGYGGTLLSVKPDAPDTWIVERKKDGRLLLRATWKLSKDGRTLTDSYREFQSDGSTLSMDYVYQRTGGGSGFAGDWQSIRETMNSPFSMQVKAFEGDGLSFIVPTEQKARNMKFDGKDYPDAGANVIRGASASMRRMDERTLAITDKVNAKVVDTEEIRLSPDLNTLTMTVHVAGRNKPNVLVFQRKQPE